MTNNSLEMHIYADARHVYDENGYYIARNMLPPEYVTACVDDISAVLADQLNSLNVSAPGDLFSRAHALYSTNIQQYIKVLGSLWRLQTVNFLFAYPGIQDFLKAALGFGTVFMPGGLSIHAQSDDLKIPGGYFGLKSHQDWPSVQGSFDGVISWVPLCHIDENSYPLEIVPGSHRSGLLEPVDGNMDSPWIVGGFADSDYKAICVSPGDVVFLSNFLVHRSGLGGKKDYLRLACSNRFDNGNEATFIRRGYPTAYTRIVHRQLMDFESVLDVNKCFDKTS